MKEGLNVAYLNGAQGYKKIVLGSQGGESEGGETIKMLEENDVTFYDYDGTILYSYTADEFLALSEMPPLPKREGLKCIEWNWTFEETYDYVSKYGLCMVGATYTTDDGTTRIYVNYENKDVLQTPVWISIELDEDSEIVVDWCDGSPTEVYNVADWYDLTHSYSTVGEHCIKIKPVKGTFTFEWHGENTWLFNKIHFGNSVKIGSYSFESMENLSEIVYPSDLLEISGEFYGNIQIKCLVVPRSCTECYSIGSLLAGLKYLCLPATSTRFPSLSNSEEGLYGIYTRIAIPPLVTQIVGKSFDGDGMCKCVIPDSIKEIGSYAFRDQYSLLELDFSHFSHVPTAKGILVSDTQPTKFIIPEELYHRWVNSTNWSAMSENIVTKSGEIPVELGVGIQHIDGSLYTKEEWISNGFTNDEANGVAVESKGIKFVIAKTSLGLSSHSESFSYMPSYLNTESKAKNDFEGLSNTKIMAENNNNIANMCVDYLFPNGSKGYLPALGEWSLAYTYKTLINEIMALIGGDTIEDGYYLSSSVYGIMYDWQISWTDGKVSYEYYREAYVRAFTPMI